MDREATQRDDLTWALEAFGDGRNQQYRTYSRYMRGDQDLAFATEKFKEAFGSIFREFAYNLCETVVDAHADRMEVTGFGSDDAAEDAIAQRAQDIWDANGMDAREGQVEADQFGLGDGYVLVEVLDGKPVIWPQQPAEMRVRYSDQHPGQIVTAARLWADAKTLWRMNVYTEAFVYRYEAPRREKAAEYPTKADGWKPHNPNGDAWPLANPVPGVVPVFHFGNNARVNSYGVSELCNVIPLQNALNKTVMDLMVAMEFAAFPQRVALGIELDPDDAEAQKKLDNFQLGITRMLTLSGGEGERPTIAEFAAANMEQYTKVSERFEQQIVNITKVPRVYLSGRDAEAISGESKRMDESPFVAKIENRQRSAGQVWSEVLRYCLMATGMMVQPGDIRVNWKPAAPISAEERVNLMLSQKAADLPLEQRLKEAGYEPDQIEAILEMKRTEREEQRQMFDAGFVLNGAGE